MDIYTLGLPLVFQWNVILMLLLGIVSGILIGTLPGLSATMAVAVFTPLTFALKPIPAFALLLGTYCSAVFGGSISAILVNIPGTPSAVMTTLDGHPMAKRGEAGRAIGLAISSSFIGGIFSVIVLMLLAPLIANFALKFSAQEYLMLALFGVSMMAYISGKSILKGLLSGLLGLFLATVGMDPGTGAIRYTMGSVDLLAGLDIVPVLIGLFGLTEVLIHVKEIGRERIVEKQIGKILPELSTLTKNIRSLVRCSVLGTLVGAAPAAGGTVAAIMAYGMEKRLSKEPEKFGAGIDVGIIAPEAANNASTGGAMIPMMTLGIPGDAVTAILIGALRIHGLQPGPLMFSQNKEIVSSIFILMALSNAGFFLLATLGARTISRVLNIDQKILYSVIALLCVVGAYASRSSLFDVAVLLVFGALGYLMNKVGIPSAPLVLGLILGPIVESNFKRTLVISNGKWSSLLTRPISLVLLLLTLLLLLAPLMKKCFPKNKVQK